MNNSKKIKAVVFDVGGVLALRQKPFFQSVHEQAAKKFNVSLDQYFDSIDSIYVASMEGRISERETLSDLSKNLKVSKKKLESVYVSLYKQNFVQNKQLFGQAFKLKQLGYVIAVFSDQWHLSQKALMPKQIYSKFDNVLVSSELGMRKPNSAFYKLLIKKLKLKPSEILFIDNQKWNINQAKKLKLKTILFKDNNSLFKNKEWKSLFE